MDFKFAVEQFLGLVNCSPPLTSQASEIFKNFKK